MKKILSVAVAVTIFLSFAACSKKQESPPPEPKAPALGQGPIIESPAVPPGHEPKQKVEFNVLVPPDVKEAWSAVKLIVLNKKTNKTQEFIVKLHGELKIPDSRLTVTVGDFLPDFKMGAQVITSSSNNPVNPAVGVKIFEDGAQIFPETGKWGWLYANHPTIHPFQHESFSVTLKEGVASRQ